MFTILAIYMGSNTRINMEIIVFWCKIRVHKIIVVVFLETFKYHQNTWNFKQLHINHPVLYLGVSKKRVSLHLMLPTWGAFYYCRQLSQYMYFCLYISQLHVLYTYRPFKNGGPASPSLDHLLHNNGMKHPQISRSIQSNLESGNGLLCTVKCTI